MTSTTLSVVSDALIGLAIIAAGVVLLALGKIDGTAATALIGAGAAYAKGATTSALALKVPTSAQTPAQPQQSTGP